MDSGRVLPCYGISQDPQTNNYILVMQYASEGNLRNYLSTSFARFDWWKKVNMLRDIVLGLKSIHNAGLVHHDFHSGNILRHGYGNDSNNLDTYISDLGLCHSVDKSYTNSKVFGVLPYLAPEVLRGEQYTKAADIYSFGIIMWEITTGDKPFYDRSHNHRLAFDICSGLRPKLMPGTPECYAQVMQKCWNADPLLRPNVDELFVMLKQFKEISNFRTQIGEAELIRFGIIENLLSTKSRKSIHPEAIYTSRLFEFSDLPQPKNADPVSIPTPNARFPVHQQLLHLASASDFGQLAARRRANSVTSHNRRPNKQTNRRSVQVQPVSNTFNERRRSRSFNNDEVAESMRRLSLSLGPKDLNAINEELFEE
ncbi:kinase-like domain-containing protein [Glomus cerebriforme]|uniref:Kinase-like domain-containing protein n=1 Tax=Glomus cerebriforme TaxID=658196 RepID=A0A397S828_9GLOM|nr:kinase-like domain-containing protein [Glomus cerebriforme]